MLFAVFVYVGGCLGARLVLLRGLDLVEEHGGKRGVGVRLEAVVDIG